MPDFQIITFLKLIIFLLIDKSFNNRKFASKKYNYERFAHSEIHTYFKR